MAPTYALMLSDRTCQLSNRTRQDIVSSHDPERSRECFSRPNTSGQWWPDSPSVRSCFRSRCQPVNSSISPSGCTWVPASGRATCSQPFLDWVTDQICPVWLDLVESGHTQWPPSLPHFIPCANVLTPPSFINCARELAFHRHVFQGMSNHLVAIRQSYLRWDHPS
jgi:hypothetical protein